MNERHEGKHLRRQEAKKRWKTILAVFLSVVLVMQSSNIQAFADVLASGGSEGRDEVVMDPAAEDTGTQGEVATPEETNTADEQASSQDDAEQTVAETEENPVETTAQDTEATTPDGQSDQAQSEQAPAEETDTTVTLNVEVSAATLKYSAQDGTEKSVTSETDPKSVDVTNTLDFTFTVAPDDSQQVSSVAYAGAALTANDSGEYTIDAADLTDGEKIVVTTEAVPTEEPAEDATPVETEETTEPTVDKVTLESVSSPVENSLTSVDARDAGDSQYDPVVVAPGESKTVSVRYVHGYSWGDLEQQGRFGWSDWFVSGASARGYWGSVTFTADEDATPGTLYRIWYGERWGFPPDGQYIYFRIGENQGTDPDQPEYVTAKFYVIRPGKDTSSTDDENWMYVGEGTIDISGLDLQPGQEPVDVSLDVDGRVQGYPNDDVIKQRIAFLYGLELSSTTITYTPYKISYPNGWVDEYGASQESATPTYHVDMAVSYSTTTKVNANFYLWDVASDGYDYLADEYQSITLVDGKGSVQSPEGNYPPTKTENDVEYVFSGWYDNSELTGTPVKFPDEVSSAKQYYAKYVPQDAYSVRYYDSHNNTNATVLPKSFNKDYPEDKVAYAATREEVVDAGGEVSQGQQQRLVGWSTEPVQGVLNGADKFEELVSAGKFVAFGQQLPQSDTDLYAIWMKESEAEKVLVTMP